MRLANISGRLSLVAMPDRALDLETASARRFSADPQAVYDEWPEFCEWAATATLDDAVPFAVEQLGAPTPRPRQIFAIGLNYGEHIAETRSATPDRPPVFTKFRSAITGPYADVEHPGGKLDWEVELVVVIGREAFRVAASDAWDYVAGLTVGQDFSEREIQHAGKLPQFSLGKSYPGFGPMGPWLVTLDEIADRNDLELGCSVNSISMQQSRTSHMLVPVAALIEQLSSIVTLYPGDAIFTGTPGGVGSGRNPQQFLTVGDRVDSYIEGIGSMRTCIVPSSAK